ncbi:hypothetical protein D3C80_1715250 [compost metagenome]
MLQLASDQVPRLVEALGNAFECQVVGFGSARRPDQVVGLRADALGHLLAGLLHGLSGSLAVGVATGRRVAEVGLAAKAGKHGFDDPIVDGGSGGIIEIEWGAGHWGGSMSVAVKSAIVGLSVSAMAEIFFASRRFFLNGFEKTFSLSNRW